MPYTFRFLYNALKANNALFFEINTPKITRYNWECFFNSYKLDSFYTVCPRSLIFTVYSLYKNGQISWTYSNAMMMLKVYFNIRERSEFFIDEMLFQSLKIYLKAQGFSFIYVNKVNLLLINLKEIKLNYLFTRQKEFCPKSLLLTELVLHLHDNNERDLLQNKIIIFFLNQFNSNKKFCFAMIVVFNCIP